MVDGLSRSSRKKLVKAQGLAGGGASVVAYGSGIGHARMGKGLVGLGVGFLVLFVVILVLVGRLLIPGVLLVLVGLGLLRPRRGVGVTPQGVLLMHESMWNAQPIRILGSAPSLSATSPHEVGNQRMQLQIGEERVRMKRREYEPLLLAAQQFPVSVPPTPHSAPAAPGWYPDPSGRYEHRYWDGNIWTSNVSANGTTISDPSMP